MSTPHTPAPWRRSQRLQTELDTLRQQLDHARAVLAGWMTLVPESRGITGYHLNGAEANWNEFDLVNETQQALAALGNKPRRSFGRRTR